MRVPEGKKKPSRDIEDRRAQPVPTHPCAACRKGWVPPPDPETGPKPRKKSEGERWGEILYEVATREGRNKPETTPKKPPGYVPTQRPRRRSQEWWAAREEDEKELRRIGPPAPPVSREPTPKRAPAPGKQERKQAMEAYFPPAERVPKPGPPPKYRQSVESGLKELSEKTQTFGKSRKKNRRWYE